MWRWVAFGSGFCGVLLAVGHSFPYPQRLFRRQRLGDEKKVLRWTALPENGNGHQVSLLAAPACIEQHLPVEIQMLKLDIPYFHTAQSATVDQADEQFVLQEFGGLKHAPDLFAAQDYGQFLDFWNRGKVEVAVRQAFGFQQKPQSVNGMFKVRLRRGF